MNNRSLRSILIPLVISVVSLLGLCSIAVYAWAARQNTPVLPTETVTPFKYALLATETALPSVVPPASEEISGLEVEPTSPAIDLGEVPTESVSEDSIPVATADTRVSTECMEASPEYMEAILSSVTAMDANNTVSTGWTVESADMVQLTILASRISGPDIDTENTISGVWGIFAYDDGSFDLYALNEAAQQFSYATWGDTSDPALTMETDGAQQAYECAINNP